MNTLSRLVRTVLALLLGAVLITGCNRQTPSTDDAGTSGSSGASGSSDTSRSSGAPPAQSSSESSGSTASGKAATAVADSAVTAKVKAALLADSDLKSTAISVDTNNGVVTLKGTLANQAQIDRAVKLASSIDGVKAVQNQLTIQR